MNLLDLFFPKSCLQCGISGKYVCNMCLGAVEYANTMCPVCGRFSFYGNAHPTCIHKYSLDGLVVIWDYKGVLRKSIIELKYKFVSEIAKELAESAAIEFKKFRLSDSFLCASIPLSTRRENWRGFNQSELIAREFSKASNIEFVPGLLRKKKDTTPQVKLKREERLRNISGKFAVNNDVFQKVKHKPVLIVDDVWTTGATLKEAARALKEAGAKKVWGMALARKRIYSG